MPKAIPLPVCPSCKGSCPCGGKVPTPKKTGRPPRYCCGACRRRASRARVRTAAWQATGALAPMPLDPLTLRTRTLGLVAEYLEGRPAAPPEEQLAQALTDLPQLIFILRRILGDLPPALAARAGALADRLDAGYREAFPELAA